MKIIYGRAFAWDDLVAFVDRNNLWLDGDIKDHFGAAIRAHEHLARQYGELVHIEKARVVRKVKNRPGVYRDCGYVPDVVIGVYGEIMRRSDTNPRLKLRVDKSFEELKAEFDLQGELGTKAYKRVF